MRNIINEKNENIEQKINFKISCETFKCVKNKKKYVIKLCCWFNVIKRKSLVMFLGILENI